jgi:hypothetical protein
LLEDADEQFRPETADLLRTQQGSFLLGGTAPDVRTISPITRQATHFYPIPPDPEQPSMQTMLRTWPGLADPWALPPEQAAFVTGYLAHLWFDEFWYMTIVDPFYMSCESWGTHRSRFNVFNVLMGHLDRQDKAELNGDVGMVLQRTRPNNWLPFVAEEDLITWRDFLAEQLLPGANTRTVEILAQRAHMDPADFAALIADPLRMEREIFIRSPRPIIEQSYRDGLTGSAEIIRRYLQAQTP